MFVPGRTIQNAFPRPGLSISIINLWVIIRLRLSKLLFSFKGSGSSLRAFPSGLGPCSTTCLVPPLLWSRRFPSRRIWIIFRALTFCHIGIVHQRCPLTIYRFQIGLNHHSPYRFCLVSRLVGLHRCLLLVDSSTPRLLWVIAFYHC